MSISTTFYDVTQGKDVSAHAVVSKVTDIDSANGTKMVEAIVSYYHTKTLAGNPVAKPFATKTFEIKDESAITHAADAAEVSKGLATKVGDSMIDRVAVTDYSDFGSQSKQTGSGKTLKKQVELFVKSKDGGTII